jgi:DNA-binding SARP family transcriptional activator
MMAVIAEPLRETAQRALIEAHIAEGGWTEGRRSFETYRSLLDRELGLQPDPELTYWLHRVLSCGITTADQSESTVGRAITAIKHCPGTDQTGYAQFAAKIEAAADPVVRRSQRDWKWSCVVDFGQAERNDVQREVQ